MFKLSKGLNSSYILILLMNRKLVKQGAATMMVSLPSEWVKQNRLVKGAEVGIQPSGKSLIVTAQAPQSKAEMELRLSGSHEVSIRTAITNAYRSGLDKVKVVFESESQFKMLAHVIKTRLIGFDITKKSKDFCIVENITEPSADQFDAILKKIFFSFSDFIDLTKRRIAGGEEDFEEVAERIQKYDNFCRRIIFKRKIISQNSEFLWTFLSDLVHASRELYHLNAILGSGLKLSHNSLDLFDESQKAFELIREAYFDKKIGNIERVHSLQKDVIYKKGYSLLESKKGKEAVFVHHVMSLIRQLHLSTSSLYSLIA
jgi:phosphate uptake regulator